jgi:hypothetical protein
VNVPIIALSALIAAGGLGAAAYVALKPTEEEKFLAACDEVVKQRLKAPATYERQDTGKMKSTSATLEEFLGWENADKRRQSEQLMVTDPSYWDLIDDQKKMFAEGGWDRVSISFAYDAANAFGTPLRSAAECSYVISSTSEFTAPPAPLVSIDGLTPSDWALVQLWLARQ